MIKMVAVVFSSTTPGCWKGSSKRTRNSSISSVLPSSRIWTLTTTGISELSPENVIEVGAIGTKSSSSAFEIITNAKKRKTITA